MISSILLFIYTINPTYIAVNPTRILISHIPLIRWSSPLLEILFISFDLIHCFSFAASFSRWNPWQTLILSSIASPSSCPARMLLIASKFHGSRSESPIFWIFPAFVDFSGRNLMRQRRRRWSGARKRMWFPFWQSRDRLSLDELRWINASLFTRDLSVFRCKWIEFLKF